ncbi:hypothetical protein INT48_001374 [Thamnidium elegans]|uniref:Dipeptidyl aminopeptidase n=1 Tax=Thamnidium elegans TaxID=101142 RepID=A0A8H7SXL8_9FUNG|nr:hypothetical protein INT48_001374 [Thamnidium elegans]
MLNPFASNFQPTPVDQPIKPIPDAPKKKSQPKRPNRPKTNDTINQNKPRDSQPADSHSKKLKGRAKVTPTTNQDIFTQESPFIAIEAAIDPIHRIDIQPANPRRQSLTIEKKFEHGYERYIDWIDRSLGCYDTVTVVGMENAIVDIVSIVTILYDRKIAAHDDVETFTMNPGNVMSFLTIPFSRLKNTFSPTTTLDNYETTEMTNIVDLDSFMALMDARKIIDIPLDDDNSSLSSDNTEYMNSPDPFINGVKYDYEQDEEHYGDEAEQSLVGNDLEGGGSIKKKGGKKWLCMSFLFLILLFWLIWTIGLSQMGPVSDPEDNESLHFDLPDLYNTSFMPKRPSLVWVKNDPRDGIFTYTNPVTNDILLESVQDGKSEIFVEATDLKIGQGLLHVNSFEISQDAKYLLLKTNVTSQWRYSSHSNIYIYNLDDKSLFPLNNGSTIDKRPLISYAVWSPTGHQVAYVMKNEIFITDLQNHTRITFDGSDTIFNGVPDWVYEEEVFAKNYALWWSPDSTHLAYLRFNETAVPEFHLQYYTASNSSYPDELTIKYPKAGAPNPLVSLHIHSLELGSSIMVTSNSTLNSTVKTSDTFFEFDDTDRLITDVIWSTETNTHLLFKQTNRVQDIEVTNLVTIEKQLNQTSIENIRTYKPNDGGWIEPGQTMVYIPNTKSNDTTIRYLDIIDNGKGFLHLAVLKATEKDSKPSWLTSGKWEVVPGTVVVDTERQLVHYVSTERSHLERHLYKIDFSRPKPSTTKTCLTCPDDATIHAYYTVTFSPKNGYYILQYEGPDTPSTVVKSVDDATFETVLQNNQALKDLLDQYELPRTRMVSVMSGGIKMDAMEVLPPDFDASKKYPVLFHVYGGPGSQIASYRFELSWSTFLASKLGYIVVTVDGRGTGFKGRKYKVGIRGRLGELETIDQINAARHWSSLEYVDSSRIAIWGWSYGGYMTSKVIEANSGIFAAGLAVAPVTDWRFYDSIYTERYMLTPQLNPDGYIQSAVNNMTGFEEPNFLLVHGTGDDNVHFQNSAVLVDKLTRANIHNYQVQFFPDSNHAIRHHNANPNLYYMLTKFLWESFGGEEYLHVRKELNGHFSGPIAGPH